MSKRVLNFRAVETRFLSPLGKEFKREIDVRKHRKFTETKVRTHLRGKCRGNQRLSAAEKVLPRGI